jgi:hypothetical protein
MDMSPPGTTLKLDLDHNLFSMIALKRIGQLLLEPRKIFIIVQNLRRTHDYCSGEMDHVFEDSNKARIHQLFILKELDNYG